MMISGTIVLVLVAGLVVAFLLMAKCIMLSLVQMNNDLNMMFYDIVGQILFDRCDHYLQMTSACHQSIVLVARYNSHWLVPSSIPNNVTTK